MIIQLPEVILLVMWFIAGAMTIQITFWQTDRYKDINLLGIRNRWCRFAAGVMLITFVLYRVYLIYTSPNLEFTWGFK